MSAMQDMTKGGAAGHLLRYAVPLMLGNWFQLAYNAVDSIIAGRFIGQDALAAVGVAGPVMNLVILAISGLCITAEHRRTGKQWRSDRSSIHSCMDGSGTVVSTH